MPRGLFSFVFAMMLAVLSLQSASVHAASALFPPVLSSIDTRFANPQVTETPDFQRHVVPLLRRLGCSGRSCHGSFQGQGGFRLSLFGYDFDADHKALLEPDSRRVIVAKPAKSLILLKPTDADRHEGGERYKLGSWQHHVLRRWIENGALPSSDEPAKLTTLEITPKEILFRSSEDSSELRVVAVWENGIREDVTPLCSFSSNNDQVAVVNESGVVSSRGKGDTHVIVSYDKAVVPIPVLLPVSDLFSDRHPQQESFSRLDELVVDKLRKLGLTRSELCRDEEFLRRVSLDLAGTLPTENEIRRFLNDERSDKRRRKIDELLATPRYATWWTTKLCDFTGNNDDQLRNALLVGAKTGSDDWYGWIRERVEQNLPYDKIVEGILVSTSRRPGESYRDYCQRLGKVYQKSGVAHPQNETMPLYWARRDFQTPEARTIGFAHAFLGARVQCAQCHKDPFDQWSQDDFHLFKNFFSGVTFSYGQGDADSQADYKEMIKEYGLEKTTGGRLRREFTKLVKAGKVAPMRDISIAPPRPSADYPDRPHESARLLGGDSMDIAKVQDPRRIVMDWLRQPDNRFFATAFVNRVWATYFNVGIVEPPDNLSLANPPSNKPLLDYLTRGFIESGYDMKWLHRAIANSRTYQTSWRPNESNRDDQRNFSRAVPRRLPAEVAYDALAQAAASDTQILISRDRPKGRAIGIPGYGRDRGYNGTTRDLMHAMDVFGRSTRISNCDCDRSPEITLKQMIFVRNDPSLMKLIAPSKISWLGELKALQNSPGPAAEQKVPLLIERAFLRTLSRFPSDEEITQAQSDIETFQDPLEGVQELLWALLNTKEFIINH
jgi:hypothetical protein